MKNSCEKWKDRLLEAALTGTTAKELEEHLRSCANCSAELENIRARAVRLDELLPLVVQTAEPSANFRARVLAAAGRTVRMIPGDELAAAQKLAEWRAPSDGLLVTPGQEILRTMPRLGESYWNVAVKTDEEE